MGLMLDGCIDGYPGYHVHVKFHTSYNFSHIQTLDSLTCSSYREIRNII